MLPAFLFSGTTFTGTIGLTFVCLGSGCILIWAVNRQPKRNPLTELIAWLGRYSYSIYLWHALPAIYVFKKLPATAGLSVAYFVVCIGTGIVVAKLIEVPALHARDRYFPSRRPWRNVQSVIKTVAEPLLVES